MIIETKRLLLTEVTMDDLENIHLLHSSPEVDEFNTLGIPKDLDETRKVLDPIVNAQTATPQVSYTFSISIMDSKEFIGLAALNLSSSKYKSAEIYYKLSPPYWNNGYATEVSKALIKSGFEDFKLHRIEAGAATENLKSLRVLEKSGMKREGHKRKVLPIRGSWIDNYEYAIVDDDYWESE
ncbi:MAG: GNAT family N-acetyltransferase [Cytophagales bacterium]|nr:GNAT family N-acetyltransferase [Cytophagales bacterium]